MTSVLVWLTICALTDELADCELADDALTVVAESGGASSDCAPFVVSPTRVFGSGVGSWLSEEGIQRHFLERGRPCEQDRLAKQC